MSHKVFVRDIVAITRHVELPDRCPKCKVEFGKGSLNVKLWSLKPQFEQIRLTSVIACGKETDVFETKPVGQPQNHGDWDRLPAIFKCANCHHTLASYHRRTYDLQDMTPALATHLQGLLYDANVKDPDIKKKVWGMLGYQGDCVACNMETELATEEVPHPIDARVHTCVRSKDVVDKKR